MDEERFEVESIKPFSESLIWQLNRDYYQDVGPAAWSENVVPHHLTCNSLVGKTYAELIFAFLKDLGAKGNTTETVYILELGAGHGRLAFHILKHLEKLETSIDTKIPPYCYVISDIVEENLIFFADHVQFESFFKRGILDYAYYDASQGDEIYLRYSQKTISKNQLNQPIVALANYFFDSIPTDLFLIREKIMSACSVKVESTEDPQKMSAENLIKNISLKYTYNALDKPFYKDTVLNEILDEYKGLLSDTYLFFPEKGMKCLTELKAFSKKGLMLLSMDKGFHEILHLEKRKKPEIIVHGSLSFWVNYHAIGAFCEKQGGKVLFPKYSTFHLDVGCFLFVPEDETYTQTEAAYQHFINDFGPDDFNTIKKMAYANVSKLKFKDLIALIRLSAYDSTFFIKLLPQLRRASLAISYDERIRLEQTLHKIWSLYFNINEPYDLAYELGGVFYDLGFYASAIIHFDYSVDSFGQKEDIYFNKALCHYQLRQDNLFYETLNEAKQTFPNSTIFEKLDSLDMTSA